MPEGPEIHLAAKFINKIASKHKFGDTIVKSEVSTKNPDVLFSAKHYKISAEARGKELKVHLEDVKNSESKTHILFRFGMSGCFKLTSVEDLPKHAHLQFYTLEDKSKVLSFVDYRRFGRWEIEGDWGKKRGPDPIFDYDNFRQNVLDHLDKAAFNKPICETLLNQTYFNGIGNYLRAEILYRGCVTPFTCAREVLAPIAIKKEEVKLEIPDLLELCNVVPREVLELDNGKNYDPDTSEKEDSFRTWLQCYYVEGMQNIVDANGRTIWFHGEAGPMKPKNAKVVGRKGGTGSKVPQSGSNPDVKEEKEDKKGLKNNKNTKAKDNGKTKLKDMDSISPNNKRSISETKNSNIKIEVNNIVIKKPKVERKKKEAWTLSEDVSNNQIVYKSTKKSRIKTEHKVKDPTSKALQKKSSTMMII